MKRPPLTPVNVPEQPPGAFIGSIATWCASAARALKDLAKGLADTASSIQQLSEGQNTVTGTVTLTASATTTTVSKDTIPPGGQPFLSPRTSNAAAEIGNGTMSIAESTKGQFVITHANNGQTDRTFGWWVTKAG